MNTSFPSAPAFQSIGAVLVQRILFPVLLIGNGFLPFQQCAGAPFKFEQTGSLITTHFEHTATLLNNGKFLQVASARDCLYQRYSE